MKVREILVFLSVALLFHCCCSSESDNCDQLCVGRWRCERLGASPGESSHRNQECESREWPMVSECPQPGEETEDTGKRNKVSGSNPTSQEKTTYGPVV